MVYFLCESICESTVSTLMIRVTTDNCCMWLRSCKKMKCSNLRSITRAPQEECPSTRILHIVQQTQRNVHYEEPFYTQSVSAAKLTGVDGNCKYRIYPIKDLI